MAELAGELGALRGALRAEEERAEQEVMGFRAQAAQYSRRIHALENAGGAAEGK